MLEMQMLILSRVIEKFSKDFINEVKELNYTLNKLGIQGVEDSLPSPFNGNKNIQITACFSIDKKQIFINFNENKNSQFIFTSVCGNPVPSGLFNFDTEENDVGISIMQNVVLSQGQNNYKIDYGFVTTLAGFNKIVKNIKEFSIEFITSNRDLNKYKTYNDKISYLNYLKKLKKVISTIFFDENTQELYIDKFLEENPVILKAGLHLDNLNHQVILKNILDKYEHDLKPDLIAYDMLKKKWLIIDYKRAKRKIIKNFGKVRSGFKADVNDLENQLYDYLEYFEEEAHRNYIEKTYKISMKHPDAIGIIGNVNEEEQETFNRLMQNKPRWFSLIPYNYLYDSFCRYIDLIEGSIK